MAITRPALPVESESAAAMPLGSTAVVIFAVALATVVVTLELIVPAERGIRHPVAAAASIVLTLVAAGLGAAVARGLDRSGRPRDAWSLLGASWVLMALQQGIELLTGPAAVGGFTHLLGVMSLTVAGLVFLALVRLPPPPVSRRDLWPKVLDAITVVVAAWMTLFYFLVGPAASGAGDWTAGERWIIAGLAGDLLVLAGAAYVLLHCPRGSRRTTLLLVASAALAAIAADVLAAADHWWPLGHTSADLPRLIPPVLFVIAAAQQRRRSTPGYGDDGLATRPVRFLPYLAVLLAYAILLASAAAKPDLLFLETLFAGPMAVLVLTRLAIVGRRADRLTREQNLRAGDSRFRAMVERSGDMAILFDADWTVILANASARQLLGFGPRPLVGRSLIDLVHPDDAADAANRLREIAIGSGRILAARWRFRRADGSDVDVEAVAVSLLDDPDVQGILMTGRDGSERRSLEAQLTHQAFHDPLTGLANRALFEDRVRHALARRREPEFETVGVVFLDLDHFKTTNDTLGHAGGDALLKIAAGRLSGSLRVFDTAARVGGDEFAVLVDGVRQRSDIIQVAERITRAFAEPFVIDGRELHATASVGVVVAGRTDTAEDLMRNADLAMYLAKGRGRGQYTVFEPSMHAAAMTRLDLQRDLRLALERGELSLAYQPVHALESRALAGAEALLRWVHPTRGPIPPSTFVPLAEEAGLMVPIGRWVLAQACRDAHRWRQQRRGSALRVSVNLSTRQIPDLALMTDVEEAIRQSGLQAGALVLELTESMLVQHADRALDLLRKLKSLGVRVAIDDFGTGYSSLSFLQRLPIDILKIDRTFVDVVATDEHAAQLTRAIVSLSESMSLVTIAEGVESAVQAERLRMLGCDFAQGYHFGMPMTADALADHVDRSRALTAV